MLLLIHNIHTGLNLNNLDVLEQCYNLKINNTGVYNLNTEITYNNIDSPDLKSVSSLYINNDVPFSF
jgi:hypothetical protein